MARPKPELLRECERVNKLLKKQAEELGLGTKKSLARMDEARQIGIKEFYYWALLEFQEYVRRQLETHQTFHASSLINDGAYKLKVSSAATKRYLGVLRSGHGPFSGIGDIIMLNPNYTEQDDYWTDDQSDQARVEEE